MCGRKLRQSFISLLLCSALLVLSSQVSLSAEVVLTDAEAQEMLNEMKQSETELNQAKMELTEVGNELSRVKAISEEQEKSFQKQLKEEKKKRILPWALTGASSTICAVLSVCLLIVLL